MSELFPLSSITVDSPKLRWMAKHDVTLTRLKNGRYVAIITEDLWGAGADEDEACLDLCETSGIKHWTLEA